MYLPVETEGTMGQFLVAGLAALGVVWLVVTTVNGLVGLFTGRRLRALLSGEPPLVQRPGQDERKIDHDAETHRRPTELGE